MLLGKRQERVGEELTDIAALVDDGAIEPHIHERFSFNEVAAAHRLAESGDFRGKLLLTNNRISRFSRLQQSQANTRCEQG